MKRHTTILGSVYESFARKTPVAVMGMATLERCLGSERIDQIFDQTAQSQYTRKFCFSTGFKLLCETVCRVHPSVCAAYRTHGDEMEG